jgi:putative hydrolase of the HAD superfamily
LKGNEVLAVKAISFDFWSTLFTEQPGSFLLYQERRLSLLQDALARCGDFSCEQIEEATLLEAREHYDTWISEHRTLGAAERVGKILTRLEASLPATDTADLVKAYEEGILERPPVLIEGVREAVGQLSGRFRLGIISDVGFSPGRVLRQVIEQNGLLGYFDSLIFSDEAGHSKPHIEVFKQTAARLDAKPHEIVHVGDLEHTDIIGAKRAGCAAVRFTGITPMRQGEKSAADFVINHMKDLPGTVEMIEGRAP